VTKTINHFGAGIIYQPGLCISKFLGKLIW